MTRYLLSKLGQAFVTVVLVMLVVFTLLRFMPTSGYFSKEQWKTMSEQEKNNHLRALGVLDPMPTQLKDFVLGLARGNLGTSITQYPKTPIATILGDKIGYSILLNAISWIVSAAIGLPLGIAMARSKGGLADKLGTVYVVIIRAVPSIIIHFFIQIYFSRLLKLPPLFYIDQPISWLLPTVSMSIASIAGYGVWLRRYVVDEENRDYIKFARVKGLPQKYIMWRHVLRNAIVPIAINIPSDFLLLLSGSLVIERLYSIPGTGGLLINSVLGMDNPLVQVLVLLYGGLSVLGVFLGDILVSFIDPRIKLVDSNG